MASHLSRVPYSFVQFMINKLNKWLASNEPEAHSLRSIPTDGSMTLAHTRMS